MNETTSIVGNLTVTTYPARGTVIRDRRANKVRFRMTPDDVDVIGIVFFMEQGTITAIEAEQMIRTMVGL